MRRWTVRLGQRYLFVVIGLTSAVLLACSSGETGGITSTPGTRNPTPTQQATAETPVATPSHLVAAEADNDSEPANVVAAGTTPTDPFTGEWDADETVQVWNWLKTSTWQTDFKYRTVHLGEIESPSFRDRIQPIDEPEFSPVSSAPNYMNPAEPVLSLVVNGKAKAYPLAILMWHELVNDTIDRRAVTATYCPLCNTAIVFDSRVDGVNFRLARRASYATATS